MTPPSTSRARLVDVAQRAGVSQTTASLVINGRDVGIADATKERIWAAVQELAYRPNASAKALRTQRSHSFGFVTDEIASTPYAGEIIRGAQEAAWAGGHVLLVVNTGGSSAVELAAVQELLDRQVDGVLFASMYTREVAVPPAARSLPTVLVNCFPAAGEPELPSVVPDDVRGGREATELLLAQGHTRIAVINGDDTAYAWSCRLQGYREALQARGLTPDPSLVVEGNWLPDGGYDVTRRLFEADDPPTALFCANDRTAQGAYDALRDLGLSIPGDVSVVGFDDQELSRYLRPPLTTMALPHHELGRRGCELLLSATPPPPARELVTCPPRIRASVAAPRR